MDGGHGRNSQCDHDWFSHRSTDHKAYEECFAGGEADHHSWPDHDCFRSGTDLLRCRSFKIT